jgi:hypothetical protein
VESAADILADAKRHRAEALEAIKAIKAGSHPLAPGTTPEKAIEVLEECIAEYDVVIGRYGWRNNAPRS